MSISLKLSSTNAKRRFCASTVYQFYSHLNASERHWFSLVRPKVWPLAEVRSKVDAIAKTKTKILKVFGPFCPVELSARAIAENSFSKSPSKDARSYLVRWALLNLDYKLRGSAQDMKNLRDLLKKNRYHLRYMRLTIPTKQLALGGRCFCLIKPPYQPRESSECFTEKPVNYLSCAHTQWPWN